jgi:DNA polymerase III psi subunit
MFIPNTWKEEHLLVEYIDAFLNDTISQALMIAIHQVSHHESTKNVHLWILTVTCHPVQESQQTRPTL